MALTVLTACVVDAVATAPSGGAAEASAVSLAGSATTFASGRITAGATGIAGRQVIAYAWPDQDARVAAGTGGLTLIPVATTTTGADGSYSLAADLGSLPARYRDADGTVSMDVYLDGVPTALSAAASGTPAAADSADVASPTRPARLSVDTRSAAVAVVVDGRRSVARAVRAVTRSVAGARTPAARSADLQPAGCTTQTLDTYTGRSEPFLRLYSNSDAPAYVTETTGSEHSLGVGFSASGSNWSASGTATMTAKNASALRHGFSHNWTVYNTVEYRRYATTCVVLGTGNQTYSQSVRPLRFDDVITSATALAAMNYSHCRTASPGDVFTKTGGSNVEFSAGVHLGFFSASARAEYSRNTEVEWQVRKAGSDMCGNNGTWLNAQNAGIKKTAKGGSGCVVHDVADARRTRAVEPDRPC